jgi:hypothetical protein
MIGLDVIFGGVTGLIGSVVTGITNYKTKKLELTHEEKMVELETKAMIKEAEMNIAVTKAEIEGEVELADSAAYIESLKAGQKSLFGQEWIDKLFAVEGKFLGPLAKFVGVGVAGAFGFIDWLRGFMRPALTAYMVGMSTVITLMAWKIINEYGLQAITADQAVQIFREVISIIIYLAVSCVTWWFGDRSMAKFLANNFGKKDK